MRCFRVVFFVLCLWLVACPSGAQSASGVEYTKLRAAGVPIHLVTVDLARSDLVLRPVITPSGHRRTFKELVRESRPVAAVNGTFFDTRTGITVGNLVSQGRLLSEGMHGSNLLFRKDGSIGLASSARNLGRYQDWAEVEFAVGGGPTLLADGQFFMDPAAEGFRDPSLFRARPRTALGVTGDGRLRMVVVTEGVSLWTLAKVMKELGCVHALNLDGGSSTGLALDGRTVVNPSRSLTNLIGVYPAHRPPSLTRAIQVAQGRAMAHFQKGQILEQRGDLVRTRSQFRQAVAKAPENPLYWGAVARVEEALGAYPLAIRDYHRAMQLFLERGDLVSAEELGLKVLDLQNDHLSANLLLGESHVDRGADLEALPFLEAVLILDPEHPKANELLEGIRYRAQTREVRERTRTSLLETLDTMQRAFVFPNEPPRGSAGHSEIGGAGEGRSPLLQLSE